MTDKERLEQAKEMVDDFKQEYETHHPMFGKEDIETMFWLIQQAERVQELEREVENLNEITESVLSVNGNYAIENIKLKRQIERYHEALNNIIKMWTESTDATDDTWLAHEMSETARKALECEE